MALNISHLNVLLIIEFVMATSLMYLNINLYLNTFVEVMCQKNYALGKPAWQSSLYGSGEYQNNLFAEMV